MLADNPSGLLSTKHLLGRAFQLFASLLEARVLPARIQYFSGCMTNANLGCLYILLDDFV